MSKVTILPLCYLPPISWFKAFVDAQKEGGVLIEKFEHFPKQTYRGRCHIHSPNGLLALTVPVLHGDRQHTMIKDIQISDNHGWQKIHWRSLQSAYRRSPFFEFYESELEPFYTNSFTNLFDFNEQVLQQLLKWLKIEADYAYTEEYVKNYDSAVYTDLRELIHPKKEPYFKTKPYYQVFGDRNGFLSDLSMVDLLFSEGNRAADYLK